MSDSAQDLPPAPTPAETPRRTWVERMEQPLPSLPLEGRIGLGLAVGTLICVLVAAVHEWGGSLAPGGRVLWTVWSVGYAGGLVAGWWFMRPLVGGRPSYSVLAAGFLVQGLTYALFWGGHVLEIVSAGEFDARPSIWQSDSLGWMLVVILTMFVVGGPILGCLASLSTRRGVAMMLAQLYGPIVFFCTL